MRLKRLEAYSRLFNLLFASGFFDDAVAEATLEFSRNGRPRQMLKHRQPPSLRLFSSANLISNKMIFQGFCVYPGP